MAQHIHYEVGNIIKLCGAHSYALPKCIYRDGVIFSVCFGEKIMTIHITPHIPEKNYNTLIIYIFFIQNTKIYEDN